MLAGKLIFATVIGVISVFLLGCAPVLGNGITAEQAIRISRGAPEVKLLLEKHPDAWAIPSKTTFSNRPCWRLDWWTKVQMESLPYPCVVVWVDAENGTILASGIPKTAKPGEYPSPVLPPQPTPSPPTPPEKGFPLWWFVVGFVIIIAIAAVIMRKLKF